MRDNTFIDYRKLAIQEVKWSIEYWSIVLNTLAFTLSNGESCNAGSKYEFNHSHTFDRNKKITKVEVIMRYNETCIIRMNFYSGKKRLVEVGWEDFDVKKCGGRVESFEIAAHEQLIGAKLYLGESNIDTGFVYGVTWLKCKIAK